MSSLDQEADLRLRRKALDVQGFASAAGVPGCSSTGRVAGVPSSGPRRSPDGRRGPEDGTPQPPGRFHVPRGEVSSPAGEGRGRDGLSDGAHSALLAGASSR
jgi:hypothetical protein